MDRLAPKSRSELDDAGQALWDDVVAGRGEGAVTVAGGLRGPANAWAHSPTVGSTLFRLANLLREEISLEASLVELAILTVASHHRVRYEWWAHVPRARRVGVGQDVIAAIAEGRTPDLDDPHRAVHRVASELVETGRLSEAAYGAAREQLDDVQLVELVTLCGYYVLCAFTLNAFDVSLPDGSTPGWPPVL